MQYLGTVLGVVGLALVGVAVAASLIWRAYLQTYQDNHNHQGTEVFDDR